MRTNADTQRTICLPPHFQRAIAVAVALMVLAAACGSSDDPTADSSTADSPSESAAADSDTDPSGSIGSELDDESDDEKSDETALTEAVDADPAEDASTDEGSDPDDRPGSSLASFGDPLFDGLGNGGYDVQHYDLEVDTTSNAQADEGAIDGLATITLLPTEDLSVFHLDLEFLTVESVVVNGAPAAFDHQGRELIITPSSPLTSGNEATVKVSYHGTPVPLEDEGDIFKLGWQSEEWGSYVVSEPLGAANWYPNNDHPGDKATFEISITVEQGQVGIGSGSLIEQSSGEGTETFVYSMPYPMATYLASVVTGDFVIDERAGPDGVRIRNVLYAPDADELRPILDRTTFQMLEMYSALFGPYPFDNYGVVAVPEPLGFALENQTLSVFGVDTITYDSIFTEQILAHELAHQWFGDAVSLAEWDDIWLNEGFATWADAYWMESNGQEFFSILDQYNSSSELGPLKGLDAASLFDENVYVRGGLTLEALRRTVGDDAFFGFLQDWVAAHSGGTASTADFLAMVDQKFGEDAQQLMKAWIFDEISPELPDK